MNKHTSFWKHELDIRRLPPHPQGGIGTFTSYLLLLLYFLFFYLYLDNRVLLSKALSCDRPEEIWCSQQILAWERSSRAYVKFEHQNSEGTYHTKGLRQKNSIVFIVQR